MSRPAKYPEELIARIRAGCHFMDAKVVARLVNVPLGYVQEIQKLRRRPDVEPDAEVMAALSKIVRDGVVA